MESGDLKNTGASLDNDSQVKKEIKFAVVPKTKTKLLLGIISLMLLLVGIGVGFYMTKLNQDLRQQADTGAYTLCGNTSCGPGFTCIDGECKDSDVFECSLDDPHACNNNPEACHCLQGDLCTGTKCEPDLEQDCKDWGREYCNNYQGFGKTCCAEGYVCCSNDDGCCAGGGPTNPPVTNPPPTEPPTTITPTATHTPTPTVTLTPVPGECAATCTNNSDCATGLVCITANDDEKYCSKPEYEAACTETPGVETCCNEPTPTTQVGPQCLDIIMYNTSGGETTEMTGDDDQNLVAGSSTVRFVCSNAFESALPDGYFYAFRVFEPCGSANHLDPIEYVNEEGVNGFNYTINMSGDYMAQCSVCHVDEAGDTVCDWESLVPSECN